MGRTNTAGWALTRRNDDALKGLFYRKQINDIVNDNRS
ncbi:hypothetical protein HALLA_15760 [Halostagnicola larsenii XH-48]|uniref:Uncharacterized protein n=1 Tax=Halostagnicola larsenii XH-48 TaxID=797299 RepID=W0JVI9_9EURY|nr:hypothetical protein HALLA_15760 [Halostagnicola larsenii XH-48]